MPLSLGNEDRRFALRLLAVMFPLALVLFGAELLLDLSMAVDPTTGKPVALGSLEVTPGMVRAIASPFARAYNNILAMLLTFIALAIPITANMYTPKLIEIFVRDRINLAVLGTYAILTAHSILAATLSFDHYAGRIPFWISCVGAIVGWTILLPYYFYVLSFLNPGTIISRVTQILLDELQALARNPAPGKADQARLNQKINHLGSVLIRAVDRGDRDVAIDAVRAHMLVLKRLRDVKARVGPAFFEVDEEILVGMSSAAVGIVTTARIWIEQRIVTQLLLAYNAALGKMPDGVSALADAVKDAAVHEARHGDIEVLDLLVRVLNTFVREAVKKKDVFSIYNVLYNYKSLMKKLHDSRPEKLSELARHLRYYADFAKQQGMPFIYELASYELAEVTEHAYEKRIPQARSLLDAVLGFEGTAASVRLVKSRLILGGYFLERERTEELAIVEASLAGVPAAILDQARKELFATVDRVFWEVTDRGTNFDYVEESRKAKIRTLFERMSAGPKSAVAASARAEG